jgi:transcriptional regulator with XRE-family HTH domain
MKKVYRKSVFGDRLIKARQAKGLTQQELADMIHVSRRVVSYYEKETDFPPSHLLPDISKALHVSIDELLGLKNLNINGHNKKESKLLKKLQNVTTLSKVDQKAILSHVEALFQKRTT